MPLHVTRLYLVNKTGNEYIGNNGNLDNTKISELNTEPISGVDNGTERPLNACQNEEAQRKVQLKDFVKAIRSVEGTDDVVLEMEFTPFWTIRFYVPKFPSLDVANGEYRAESNDLKGVTDDQKRNLKSFKLFEDPDLTVDHKFNNYVGQPSHDADYWELADVKEMNSVPTDDTGPKGISYFHLAYLKDDKDHLGVIIPANQNRWKGVWSNVPQKQANETFEQYFGHVNKYNLQAEYICRSDTDRRQLGDFFDSKSSIWPWIGAIAGIGALLAALGTAIAAAFIKSKFQFFVYDAPNRRWTMVYEASESYNSYDEDRLQEDANKAVDKDVTISKDGIEYRWNKKWIKNEPEHFPDDEDRNMSSENVVDKFIPKKTLFGIDSDAADKAVNDKISLYNFDKNTWKYYAQYESYPVSKLVFHVYCYEETTFGDQTIAKGWNTALSTIVRFTGNEKEMNMTITGYVPWSEEKNQAFLSYNMYGMYGSQKDEKSNVPDKFVFQKKWYLPINNDEPLADDDVSDDMKKCFANWIEDYDTDPSKGEKNLKAENVIEYSTIVNIKPKKTYHFYGLYRKEEMCEVVYKTVKSISDGNVAFDECKTLKLPAESDFVPVGYSVESVDAGKGKHLNFNGKWIVKDTSDLEDETKLPTADDVVNVKSTDAYSFTKSSKVEKNMTAFGCVDAFYDVAFYTYKDDNGWMLYGEKVVQYLENAEIKQANNGEMIADPPSGNYHFSGSWVKYEYDVDPSDEDKKAFLTYDPASSSFSNGTVVSFGSDSMKADQAYKFYALYGEVSKKAEFYVYDFSSGTPGWKLFGSSDITNDKKVNAPGGTIANGSMDGVDYTATSKWVLRTDAVTSKDMFLSGMTGVIDSLESYVISGSGPVKFYAVYDAKYYAVFYIYDFSKDNAWKEFTKVALTSDGITAGAVGEDTGIIEAEKKEDNVSYKLLADRWILNDDNGNKIHGDVEESRLVEISDSKKFVAEGENKGKTLKFYAAYETQVTVAFYRYIFKGDGTDGTWEVSEVIYVDKPSDIEKPGLEDAYKHGNRGKTGYGFTGEWGTDEGDSFIDGDPDRGKLFDFDADGFDSKDPIKLYAVYTKEVIAQFFVCKSSADGKSFEWVQYGEDIKLSGNEKKVKLNCSDEISDTTIVNDDDVSLNACFKAVGNTWVLESEIPAEIPEKKKLAETDMLTISTSEEYDASASEEGVLKFYAVYQKKTTVVFYTYNFEEKGWKPCDPMYLDLGTIGDDKAPKDVSDGDDYGFADGWYVHNDEADDTYFIDGELEDGVDFGAYDLSDDAPVKFYAVYSAKVKVVFHVVSVFGDTKSWNDEYKVVKVIPGKKLQESDIPVLSEGESQNVEGKDKEGNKVLFNFSNTWFREAAGAELEDCIYGLSEEQKSSDKVYNKDALLNLEIEKPEGDDKTIDFYSIYGCGSLKAVFMVYDFTLNQWKEFKTVDDYKKEGDKIVDPGFPTDAAFNPTFVGIDTKTSIKAHPFLDKWCFVPDSSGVELNKLTNYFGPEDYGFDSTFDVRSKDSIGEISGTMTFYAVYGEVFRITDVSIQKPIDGGYVPAPYDCAVGAIYASVNIPSREFSSLTLKFDGGAPHKVNVKIGAKEKTYESDSDIVVMDTSWFALDFNKLNLVLVTEKRNDSTIINYEFAIKANKNAGGSSTVKSSNSTKRR